MQEVGCCCWTKVIGKMLLLFYKKASARLKSKEFINTACKLLQVGTLLDGNELLDDSEYIRKRANERVSE